MHYAYLRTVHTRSTSTLRSSNSSRACHHYHLLTDHSVASSPVRLFRSLFLHSNYSAHPAHSSCGITFAQNRSLSMSITLTCNRSLLLHNTLTLLRLVQSIQYIRQRQLTYPSHYRQHTPGHSGLSLLSNSSFPKLMPDRLVCTDLCIAQEAHDRNTDVRSRVDVGLLTLANLIEDVIVPLH